MAIINSLFPPRGGVDDAIFRELHGQHTVSLMQAFNQTRWERSPKYRFARRAAREFGGASKATKQFYRHLKRIGNLMAPYTHNTILQTVLAAGRHNEPTRKWQGHPAFTERFTARNCAVALTGLDLTKPRKTQKGHLPTPSRKAIARTGEPDPRSQAAKEALAFARPYGQPVRRTTTHVPIAGGITISGLKAAAAALATCHPDRIGGTCSNTLECRIHIHYVPFVDFTWDGTDYSPARHDAPSHNQGTDWIPAEGIPDTVTLKVKSPGEICHDGVAYVALAIVEWMARRGRKVKYRRDAATVLVLGTLHPDLPDTPPAVRKPAKHFKPHRNAKRSNRPRVSPGVRARAAIAAFDHLFDKIVPGGPKGRYANPKWHPPHIQRPGERVPASAEHAPPE